jgi:Zn-dependent protease with chaperone function
MENLLWERLDPKGAASHEIALASLGDVSIWRTIKWISLFLGVLCGLLAIINKLFPYRGFALGLRSDVRLGTILLHRLLDVPRIAGTWGNLFLSFLCGLALIISGWQTSSLTLPHRYHWKCRFYGTYLIWCTAAWLPALMLAVGASKDFFVPVRYSSQLFSILRTMSVMVILFFQGLYVSMVLRMLPGYERPKKQEDYYTPPSARYEVLSEKSIGDDIDLLVTRYKSWTWASFLVFTVLYYLAAAYLIITMVETTDAILGQSWALDSSWRWPLLLPAEGRGAALQSLLLTSLMSCPLAVTVVQAVRAKLRLSKRVALSREFARGFEKLGLPDGPIENLKQSLKTEFIQVALIPVSGINIQIERTAIFKRKYLLWVSAGAQKTLSKGEMEALLWHECGHTALLKRTSWRHLLAIVAPASARFVDLAEDLYEEERKADIHAVRQMGTAYHLLSALKKAREQQSIASEPDIAVENQQAKWATTEHVRMVWNYGWAAYLHPDLDQRIRWLEERSQMVVEHGQAV